MRIMSLLRLRRLARNDSDDAIDNGLSLIELVVATSIFTIVLSIYFGALISMSHTTVRAQDSVDASDALRATFNALDHQVRYATSINRPVKGSSGAWYVELEATNLPDGAKPMCYQWRLDPATKVLSTRTWTEDGTSVVTAWHGVSWRVGSGNVNGAGVAVSPFVFAPAGNAMLRQQLSVHLTVDGATTGRLAEQSTTFIARNSSSKSPSNLDANNDGVSDNQVCMTGMDRP
jgi:prepilin-type N-terminal cleavage/methylation domain-containing protein